MLNSVIASSCLAVSLSLMCAEAAAFDPYASKPISQQSDFDRAMKNAASEARKDPVYTPPNPHEGRLQIPGKDYSVGGTVSPPSVNVRTTTSVGE